MPQKIGFSIISNDIGYVQFYSKANNPVTAFTIRFFVQDMYLPSKQYQYQRSDSRDVVFINAVINLCMSWSMVISPTAPQTLSNKVGRNTVIVARQVSTF